MYTVRIVPTIAKVEKTHWNALIDDNVFVSHQWIEVLEKAFSDQVTPLYFLIYEEESLLGAAACFIFPQGIQLSNIDDWLLGRAKRILNRMCISFLPVLICCPARSHGSHFLMNKRISSEKERSIMKTLLKAIEKEALARRLSIVFYRVMDRENELMNILIKNKYYRTIGAPLNYMDINWISFDEYLQQIRSKSKKRFKNIRYEINKNRKEGVVIRELSDIQGYEERLYQLLRGNHEKHNYSVFPFNRYFLMLIKEKFRDDAVFFIASKNKQIIGANLLLKRKTTGFCSFVGVDHEMGGNDFTYFNLAYYHRISYAISNNIKKLYYGNAFYELKRKRGCKISNTQFFYKPSNTFGSAKTKALFSLHSKWMKHKLPEIDHQTL